MVHTCTQTFKWNLILDTFPVAQIVMCSGTFLSAAGAALPSQCHRSHRCFLTPAVCHITAASPPNVSAGFDPAPHQHPCTKFQSLIHRIHFISLRLQLQSSAASGHHREVTHSCERQVSDAPDHLRDFGSTNGSEPGSLSPPTPPAPPPTDSSQLRSLCWNRHTLGSGGLESRTRLVSGVRHRKHGRLPGSFAPAKFPLWGSHPTPQSQKWSQVWAETARGAGADGERKEVRSSCRQDERVSDSCTNMKLMSVIVQPDGERSCWGQEADMEAGCLPADKQKYYRLLHQLPWMNMGHPNKLLFYALFHPL